ncbi:MAG: putative cell wall hydrolase LytN precursor [Pelotomaculum sp. PtaB.Bin104]|nr:MAG: putative cell wall hydrolase LytN precursor [Pelotomaculum sp. PtaB.Bin104]
MPLVLAEVLLDRSDLGGPVRIGWGNVISDRPDLVAVAGSKAFLFYPTATGYSLAAEIDLGTEILSLEVGLREGNRDKILLGTVDRVVVYTASAGSLVQLWETVPETGARFVDLALARLNGDGVESLIAAAELRESLYFYQPAGQNGAGQGLQLLAIRVVPGPPQYLAILNRSEGQTPLIAVAYLIGGASGLILLNYTEVGIAEGPALENLPALVEALAAGDLRPAPGDELSWGGSDGRVRVIEVAGLTEPLTTVLTSDNLGTSVPALTVGRLIGDNVQTLLAGTPGGYIFGFRAPVEQTSPDWVLYTGSQVIFDLAVSSEGLLGLGTAGGGLQVWRIAAAGAMVHVVRPGETLASIAALYRTTAEELARINNLTNPNLIFPGQSLLIPQNP